ncbi:MAG: alpha/beta hydrolase [Phycisphaerae bacterium]|nr:alpha/beta hydrolase [Phycisphaerae bacterium]
MGDADVKFAEGAAQASKPTRRQRVIKFAKRLAVLYLCWCLLLIVGQRWLVFPDFASPEPSVEEKYDNSTVVLNRDLGDGDQVVAWFVPCPAARKGIASPLVVYFHGNAEIIDSQRFAIELYRAIGCSVLLPEYRGYGRSAGQPSEAAIVDDAVFFVNEALKRPEVDPKRVVYHGRSLGGGVAVQTAARLKPRALILGSTFTSLRPFARRYLAPAFLLRSPFDTDQVLPMFDIPILIHHGTRDNIVPVWHGRELQRIGRDVTYIEYDCMHNDFPGDANLDRYPREIEKFLQKNGIIP